MTKEKKESQRDRDKSPSSALINFLELLEHLMILFHKIGFYFDIYLTQHKILLHILLNSRIDPHISFYFLLSK